MPSKSRKLDDPIRSAAMVFAVTAATDAEFAAGITPENVRTILTGNKTEKKKRKPIKKR